MLGCRYLGESTKHGPLVHGPPPWTRSMDRVHENMDRVHGPPIFTTPSKQRPLVCLIHGSSFHVSFPALLTRVFPHFSRRRWPMETKVSNTLFIMIPLSFLLGFSFYSDFYVLLFSFRCSRLLSWCFRCLSRKVSPRFVVPSIVRARANYWQAVNNLFLYVTPEAVTHNVQLGMPRNKHGAFGLNHRVLPM